MLSLVAALAIGLSGQDGSTTPQSSNSQPTLDVSVFTQVYRNWIVSCEPSGVRNIRVAVDVEIDSTGHFVGTPVLVRPVDSPEYRLAAASAVKALLDTEPFDVPAGFGGGRYRPTFVMARVCPNR